MKPVIPTLAALLLLGNVFISSGCSFLSDSSEKEPEQQERAEQSQTSNQQREAILLTWEVPSEPVDGFVIRYGTKQNQLDKELKIAISELKQEQDQDFGPVYRYTVPDVPRGVPLFAAIAAYKGDRLSDFSEAVPTRE